MRINMYTSTGVNLCIHLWRLTTVQNDNQRQSQNRSHGNCISSPAGTRVMAKRMAKKVARDMPKAVTSKKNMEIHQIRFLFVFAGYAM